MVSSISDFVVRHGHLFYKYFSYFYVGFLDFKNLYLLILAGFTFLLAGFTFLQVFFLLSIIRLFKMAFKVIYNIF